MSFCIIWQFVAVVHSLLPDKIHFESISDASSRMYQLGTFEQYPGR